MNSISRIWTGKILRPGCAHEHLHQLVAFARRTAPSVVVIVLNLFR